MTIQINVLIWTVICFCAFMLILWCLLLKPMLALLDARKAKLAHARSLDRSAEHAEKLALEEARHLEEARSRAEERKQMVQVLRDESRVEREAREKRFRRETQEKRQETEAEAADLVPQLAVSLKDHVIAFTDKLMAFGER